MLNPSIFLILLLFFVVNAQDECESDTDPECRHCPKWGPWQNATCWWPSKSLDSLPKSCSKIPFPPKVPVVIRQLFISEIKDKYSLLVNEYTERGKPAICGHCSLSFKCRLRGNRTDADDDVYEDEENESFDKRDRRRRPFCVPKQVRLLKADCKDTQPCQIKKLFGGCPTPFFLKRSGHRRAHSHMENGDYQKAINELVNAFQYPENMDNDREKRQTDIELDDLDEDNNDFQTPPKNSDTDGAQRPPGRINWLNRRWRPWLRNRYSNSRAGIYPSDRVSDYDSMTNEHPGSRNGYYRMRNRMFIRRQQAGQDESRHGGGGGKRHGHHPDPKKIIKLIIYWLLHGTKCISSGNTCLCCCGHYVPNAQNKTCDDVKKLPHFSNLVSSNVFNDDNFDFLSQLPMMAMDDYSKQSYNQDLSAEKMWEDF